MIDHFTLLRKGRMHRCCSAICLTVGRETQNEQESRRAINYLSFSALTLAILFFR